MTANEVIKWARANINRRVCIDHVCLRSGYGCSKGQQYAEIGTIYAVRRVRRTQEEPHTEIVFEIQPTGYTSVRSDDLESGSIEVCDRGFAFTNKNDGTGVWKQTITVTEE